MGEDAKTYTFTATLSDDVPDLECKPAIENVTDRIAEAGTAAKQATKTLEALCEVLNVDRDKLKEKMVIQALKEGNEGYGCGYVGNFYADALEVIERLINERDDARNQYVKSREECDALHDENRRLRNKMDRAVIRLDEHTVSFGRIEDRRKYDRRDIFEAQFDIFNQMGDVKNRVIKILTEDDKK